MNDYLASLAEKTLKSWHILLVCPNIVEPFHVHKYHF